MKNKEYILSVLVLFIICTCNAQVQNNPPMRQVLSTTGGSKSLSFGSIDYTVGDFMVNTYSGNASVVKVITQGFQQPESAERDTTKVIPPLHFYSGITPNGDGENDKWQIDGIAKFPKNTVSIFNRWGDKVWNAEDYDNMTTVWDGKNNGGTLLPDATYFYIIETGEKTFKGWVELTK